MTDRFERLFSLPNNLYKNDAPIVILAGVLLKDQQTGAIITQLKIQNLSSKVIKAVKISLSAYDVSGKALTGIEEYQYLDMSIEYGGIFGTNKAIVMPNHNSRTFAIGSIMVIFSDNSSWEENGEAFHALPTSPQLTESFSDELIHQYKRLTTNNAYFIPQEKENMWICTCGGINKTDICSQCKCDKNTVFSSCNSSILTSAMNAHNENLKVQKEKEELQKSKDKKKKIKLAILFTSIVCVIVAFVIVVNTIIIQLQKKNDFIATYGQKAYDSFGVVEKGEHITFGRYEQDNNSSNGKEEIEWLVLEVKNGKALIISKYALDCQQYNTEDTKATWETSTLRKWLNNEFLSSAFTNSENKTIITTTVTADNNPEHYTYAGNDTFDKIFLLSITEANKYFADNEDRCCDYTVYGQTRSYAVKDLDLDVCNWWLRSPGESQYKATLVRPAGDIPDFGYSVNETYSGVRPALWIDFTS